MSSIELEKTKLHALDFTHKAIARFWSRVDTTESCWAYSGPSFNQRGYGAFNYRYKRYAAHRVAYQLLKGDIPPEYVVDHLCRNVCCVNPQHLEAVTNHENVVVRGVVSPTSINARKTHCSRGHLFDDENTHYKPQYGRSVGIQRMCRVCDRHKKLEKRRLLGVPARPYRTKEFVTAREQKMSSREHLKDLGGTNRYS